MYKQIIIARKDLNMSPGKLAAQVTHASTAYFTNLIKEGAGTLHYKSKIASYIITSIAIEYGIYNEWINGTFTKTVLEARNRNQLLKAKKMAEDLNLIEGKDFWLIKDNCNTELNPEEIDKNGIGRTLTCIGFKPMDSEVIDQIGKKFQLYKGSIKNGI